MYEKPFEKNIYISPRLNHLEGFITLQINDLAAKEELGQKAEICCFIYRIPQNPEFSIF